MLLLNLLGGRLPYGYQLVGDSGEDVAASGGYWLASAADEIIADESSVIGSIGVISMGFGLNEFINRHGVERRVYTAGKSKSMLDPFQPEKPADVKRLKVML
jgi:serine protease SohB